MRHPLRAARAIVVVAAALALPVAVTAPAHAATPPPVDARATAAVDWLSHELAANGDAMPSPYSPDAKDWGLTIDSLLALVASGRGTSATAIATTDQLATHVASYVSGVDFEAPDDRYAGAIGKALLAATVQGRDPQAFGGWDLEQEARDRMQTTGDQTGRFSDKSSYGDYSNGFGQALTILGLTRTKQGAPAAAIQYLLAQQCPGGGFRLYYDKTPGCASDAEADTDATAFALQALVDHFPAGKLSDPPTNDELVFPAVPKAVTWLEQHQQADGGFGGTGPTAAVNASTTGVSGQALHAHKQATPAAGAQTFVAAHQLTATNAGAASADVGAIAYTDGALGTAETDGISALSRDQWRRTTAQAVLAFGLPAYSQIGLTIPAPAATLSTATAQPGTSITVTGTGFAYGETVTVTLHSDPIVMPSAIANARGDLSTTFALPNLAAGVHQVELAGATSGLIVVASLTVQLPATTTTSTTTPASVTVNTAATAPTTVVSDVSATSATSGTLPATGSDHGVELSLAVALILGGGFLIAAARRRSTTTGVAGR